MKYTYIDVGVYIYESMDMDIERAYFQKLESKCKYTKHAETEKGREREIVREREREKETDGEERRLKRRRRDQTS